MGIDWTSTFVFGLFRISPRRTHDYSFNTYKVSGRSASDDCDKDYRGSHHSDMPDQLLSFPGEEAPVIPGEEMAQLEIP